MSSSGAGHGASRCCAVPGGRLPNRREPGKAWGRNAPRGNPGKAILFSEANIPEDNVPECGNGTRERTWQTRVGSIPLQIPRLRAGTYFPSLFEPRRRAEQALLNVIQQAYVEGVSTRKVDDLVQAMGLDGSDKSTVSRICQSLDEVVTALRSRALAGAYP